MNKQNIDDYVILILIWEVIVGVGCIILIYIFIKEMRKKK